MIAGKLDVSVECSPLLGPQLMAATKDLMAGKTLPRRIVTEEGIFPMKWPPRNSRSASTDSARRTCGGERTAADPVAGVHPETRQATHAPHCAPRRGSGADDSTPTRRDEVKLIKTMMALVAIGMAGLTTNVHAQDKGTVGVAMPTKSSRAGSPTATTWSRC